MTDVATVAAEIAGLLRGRVCGVRTLSIGLAPMAVLNLDDGTSAVDARDHLVAALRASSSTPPKDFRSSSTRPP